MKKYQYYVIGLLLGQVAYVFCCQQPEESMQQFFARLFPFNMTPLQSHVLYSSRTWHQLPEQEKGQKMRQLVIKSDRHDSTWHQVHCCRFDSDVVMLLYLVAKNGNRVFVASSYTFGSIPEQLQMLQSIAQQEQDGLVRTCLTILYPKYDRGAELKTPVFMESYKKQIEETLCKKPELLGYNLVSGSIYRDRNHLSCVMTKDGVSWESAIDGYQQHKIK